MALVLMIDDDPQMRATGHRILASAGHTVLEANNGREGLTAFQRHMPAIVVTDILMPEKEGIETILTLRRMSPGIGILAISGGGQTGKADFLHLAKKLGADRVLYKPFRAADLIAAVNDLLAGRKPDADVA